MQPDNDELKAIIDTARQLYVSVTAHAYTSDLINNLINLGITGIEHGSPWMKRQQIQWREQEHIWYLPLCPIKK